MRVLLVKMSSLGDVIHTLPALTDLSERVPNVSVDWVVEPAFGEIPAWHPKVHRVIEMPLRHMRKQWRHALRQGTFSTCIGALRETAYDMILDAQGLLKSALVAQWAKGPRVGFDRKSARESLASWGYHRKINVPKYGHAIHRLRQLFAGAFEYPVPQTPLNFGISKADFQAPMIPSPYVVFLHGTTWSTKHWPVAYWQQLTAQALSSGYQVVLPWGNTEEWQRAVTIKQYCAQRLQKTPHILKKKLSLTEIAHLLAYSSGIVAVDTGLGHLASALETPCVSIYGPTDPKLTGALGSQTVHLTGRLDCAPCLKKQCQRLNTPLDPATIIPCFEENPPHTVWHTLQKMISPSPQSRTHAHG